MCAQMSFSNKEAGYLALQQYNCLCEYNNNRLHLHDKHLKSLNILTQKTGNEIVA